MDQTEQCKEVYAHFGLAMYRAQCVEQSIIQLLIFFDFFRENVPIFESREKWEESFDLYNGDLSAKTMGQLIKNLRNLGAIPVETGSKLGDALKNRNWLAHSFFVDHSLNFLSEAGRLKMIDELEACTSYFNEIEDVLNPITYKLCEKYGLTEEIRHETEQRMFKEANGDL